MKRLKSKLYHKDTSFLLNYLTLNVKDKQIKEEIDKERTIMMETVFCFFTLLTLLGFLLNLSNYLISGRAEMTVLITLGVDLAFFVIWKIFKVFSNKYPRFIFPIFYLMVVILLNISILQDESSILRLNMTTESPERFLTTCLIMTVPIFCYSDFLICLVWYTPIYLVGCAFILKSKIEW